MAFPLLGAFLATSIGDLTKRALLAIGLGTVTYAGLDTAIEAAKTQVLASYGALPVATMQLADLAGVGQTIGIVLGAIVARAGIAAVSHIGRVL